MSDGRVMTLLRDTIENMDELKVAMKENGDQWSRVWEIVRDQFADIYEEKAQKGIGR
jgi:hypothetical protein